MRTQCTAGVLLAVLGRVTGLGGGFLCKGGTTNALTVSGIVQCEPAVTVILAAGQNVVVTVNNAVTFMGIRFDVPEKASLRFTGGTVQFNDEQGFTKDLAQGGAIENAGRVFFEDTATFVQYEADTGAAIFNSGTMRFQDATFTDCVGITHGAVYNSGNMTFSASASFANNQVLNADGVGGGLSNAAGASVTFAEDVQFTTNIAGLQGGGVNNLGDIAFNGPTVFSANNAVGDGGGLANSGTILFRGKATFALNAARTSGGGAEFAGGDVTFLDTADFQKNNADNNGGGFDMTGGTLTFVGLTTFTDNNAGLLGGATSVGAGCFFTARQDVTFTQNTAQSGGALANLGNTTMIQAVSFMNNTATNMGGGVYNEAQLSMSGAVTYTLNTAASGGGLYAAALSTTTMDGRKTFTSNTATTTGGGLAAAGAVNMLGYTGFESNSAQTGGGAYLGVAGSVFEFTVFELNKADKDGGGLAVLNGATFTDFARFANNTAQGMGGAVLASAGQLMFTDITLVNNTASQDGGALAVLTDSLIVSGVLAATQNIASGRGGGIFFSNPDIIIDLSDSRFTSNSAYGIGGGGVYAESCSNMALSGAQFRQNTALNGEGGGAYITNCALNGTTLSFSDNKAINGGGLALIGTTSGQLSTLDDNSFRDSMAVGGSGGHIYTDGIALTVSNSDFSGGIAQASLLSGTNVTTFSGGAIFCTASSSVDIADTKFEGNSAGTSGGSVGGASSCGVTLMNTKFSGSSANCCYFEDPVTSSGSGKLTCEDANLGDDLSKCCVSGQVWGVSPLTGQSACIACDPAVPGCAGLGVTEDELGSKTHSNPIAAGYWRVPDEFINTTLYVNEARVCWNADACVGGYGEEEPLPASIADSTAFCADGYQGPYCSTCSNDHAQTLGYTCESCSSTALIVTYVLMGVLILTAIAGVTFLTILLIRSGTIELHPHSKHSAFVDRLRIVPWSRLMIALVALQIITLYVDVTGALLPESYQKFLSFLSIVNLDLSWMGGFQCIVSYGFYASLLLKTLAPLGVLAYLGITYSVAMRDVNNRQKKVVLHEVDEEKVISPNRTLAKVSAPQVTYTREERVKITHLTAVLVCCWVYYTTASSVILQTFPCEELANGDSYLRADMSVSCDTSKHTGFVVYAAIMCLVYPIGIPALFAYLLHHHKHHRDEDDEEDHKQPTWIDAASQFLWKPYTKSAVYWEIFECIRRVLLTSIAVLITPGSPSQYSACALFAALYMVVFLVLRPHTAPLCTWINLEGSMMVFLSMYLSVNVYLSNDPINAEPSGRTYLTYSILLIGLNVGMVISAFSDGNAVEKLFKEAVTSARIRQKSMIAPRPFSSKPRPGTDETISMGAGTEGGDGISPETPTPLQRSGSSVAKFLTPCDIELFEEGDTARRQRKDAEEQDGPALKA